MSLYNFFDYDVSRFCRFCLLFRMGKPFYVTETEAKQESLQEEIVGIHLSVERKEVERAITCVKNTKSLVPGAILN